MMREKAWASSGPRVASETRPPVESDMVVSAFSPPMLRPASFSIGRMRIG